MDKRIMRKVLMIILIVVFIFSGVQLGIVLLEYKQGEDIYEDALAQYASSGGIENALDKVVSSPPDNIDFESLITLNSDIAGWIWINDSNINYPVVQGQDNQRYLTVTYDKSYNKLGSIFIDYRCEKDFNGLNTILYGHNMKNDAMFGTLEKYKDDSYYMEHKYIYIIREQATSKYEVFSAYVTDAYSDAYTYEFNGEGEFLNYLTRMKQNSLVDSPLELQETDKIITLSTCTSSNKKTERFVVHAKEILD